MIICNTESKIVVYLIYQLNEKDMKNGANKLTWIKSQIEAGKTVYFSTQMRVTKITKKHLGMLQIGKDGGIYINGICFDYAKLSAQ